MEAQDYFPVPNTHLFFRRPPNGPGEIVGAGRFASESDAERTLRMLQDNYAPIPVIYETVTHTIFLESHKPDASPMRVVLMVVTDPRFVDMYLSQYTSKFSKYGEVYCETTSTRRVRTPPRTPTPPSTTGSL